MAICPDNDATLTGANPAQLAPSSPILNNTTNGIAGGVGSGSGGTSAVFDVNKMLVATQNYLAINAVVNEMFGYQTKWFRAVPQQRSKDVIFQEYTLSNVEVCPLDVKVVVPDGKFPDSKYNFDLMGLEYEVPLEIHIDKKYWESIAGFGTAPQKKDIVYFMLPNKLYEVESSHLYRGFMEQETTWKLNLKKYQPEASRREAANLQSTIDAYTVSSEEIFGAAVDANVAKLVDEQQFSQYNGTVKDNYRTFDASLRTVSNNFTIYGTVVAQSYYDLQTSNWYNAVTYINSDTISTTSDRSILAWIQPRTIPSIHKEYSVSSIIPVSFTDSTDTSIFDTYDASLYSRANYTVTLSSPMLLSNITINDNIVIARPGALNFYAKVVAISVNPVLQLHCMVNAYVLEDLVEIKSDWNTLPGYKLTIKEPVNILDGVNDFGDHVLSVNVFANQYIAINYGRSYSNDDAYVLKLTDKLYDDQWYGIIVNIGNSWKQYNINVWEKHITDKNVKLQQIYYETLRLYSEEIGIDHYTINRSPAYLTNLRLYNTTIEEEKMANELLSYFIKDADQLVIGDNADPILRLPYVTKQR